MVSIMRIQIFRELEGTYPLSQASRICRSTYGCTMNIERWYNNSVAVNDLYRNSSCCYHWWGNSSFLRGKFKNLAKLSNIDIPLALISFTTSTVYFCRTLANSVFSTIMSVHCKCQASRSKKISHVQMQIFPHYHRVFHNIVALIQTTTTTKELVFLVQPYNKLIQPLISEQCLC